MKNRLLLLLLSFMLALTVVARAQDDDDDDDQMRPPHPRVMNPTEKPAGAAFSCPYDKDYQKPYQIGAYTLRLLPTEKEKEAKEDKKDKKGKKDKDDDDDKFQDGDARCRAVLSRPGHKQIVIAYEWALSVDPISGSDINGDGLPEVVLGGYTGGLHCCYSYEIVSLGKTPETLHTLQSPVPITFEKRPEGTALIRASDGVFNYFIVPPTEAVMPRLVLKPEGNNLVDVSAQYPEVYDKEIEQTRKQITPEDLENFRKSNYHDKLFLNQYPTVHKVLTIVLDYVYSGRQDLAWQTLDEMWPAADVSRVKSLIRERRGRGMLANLACDCHPAMIAHQARRPKRKAEPPDITTDPRIKSIIDD
jgi:hypothetical protein